MSLFSIRNMLGVAAIYGGWKYSQKHGGVKQSIDGLLDKVRNAADLKQGRDIDSMRSGSTGSNIGASVSEESGFGSSTGGSTGGTYGGGGYSGGYGGGSGGTGGGNG